MTDPTVPDLTPGERQRVLTEGRRRVRNRQRAGIAAGLLALLAVLLPMAFMLGSGRDNSKQVFVGGRGTSTSAAPSTSTGATSGVASATVSPTTVPRSTSTKTVPPRTSAKTVPPPTAPSTTAVPEVSAVQTIVPDAATKAALRQAFLTYKGLQSNEIEPEPAGNVYVAHVAAAKTYWATAQYTPSAAMTFQHSVNMQDGGNFGIFTRWDGGTWKMIALGAAPCGAWGVVPNDVQRAWGIPAPTMAGCDRQVPPAAGLLVDADYFLVPTGWTVTPVQGLGGSASYGTIVAPNGGGRIDIEENGGSFGPGGFYNADGTPNLDSATTKALVGCTPTSWQHLDTATVVFTCAATAAGFDVSGIVRIEPKIVPATMLKVTMPPADRDLAATIVDFERSSPVGMGFASN